MAKNAVTISVTGQYTDKDIKRAIRDLESLRKQGPATSKQMASLGKTMKGLAIGAAAGFGLAEVTNQLRQMVTAAAEDQRSVVALSRTLSNLGMDGAASEVEQFIKQTMLATGVTDDLLRPAFSRLVRSTNDVAESQKALQIALDISAATGKDLDTVANGLGKAYDGNAASLGRLGLGLDKTLLKSGDMAQITDELTAKFGGQAADAAGTFAGRMRRVDTAVSEAQETIGYELLNGLDGISRAMGGTDGVISMIDGAAESVANFTRGLGDGIAAIADFTAAFGGTGESSLLGMVASSYKWVPGFGLLVTTTQGMAQAGESARRAEQELNDELARSRMLRQAYAGQLNNTNDELRNEASYAERAAAAVDKLNGALDRRNNGQRSLIQSNIRIRELRAGGAAAYAGSDKKLSMDERKQFGLDYASAVSDKYDALVGAGRLKAASRLLRGSRAYLGQQVGDGFGARVLGTPAELPAAIEAKDRARSEAGANQWRQSMSSVFGGDVTINVNAETPAQAVQQVKQWARLAAAGRGPAMPTDYAGRPGAPSRRGAALGLNPATGGAR